MGATLPVIIHLVGTNVRVLRGTNWTLYLGNLVKVCMAALTLMIMHQRSCNPS